MLTLTCPDFIASWHSQLGWLAMRPTRIAQNAAGIMRPAAEIAPFLERQPVHAISLDLKRQNIDRIAVSEEQITSGLAQLTAGQGANEARHRQLRATELQNHHNNSEHPAQAASDRSISGYPPVQPQMCVTRSSIGCGRSRTSPIGWGVGS
jgi:hypothetical protein